LDLLVPVKSTTTMAGWGGGGGEKIPKESTEQVKK